MWNQPELAVAIAIHVIADELDLFVIKRERDMSRLPVSERGENIFVRHRHIRVEFEHRFLGGRTGNRLHCRHYVLVNFGRRSPVEVDMRHHCLLGFHRHLCEDAKELV